MQVLRPAQSLLRLLGRFDDQLGDWRNESRDLLTGEARTMTDSREAVTSRPTDIDVEGLREHVSRHRTWDNTLYRLEEVVACAMAEVLAKGYRSTDMANALKALAGEFWFEEYVEPNLCRATFTEQMDDGPLGFRCRLPFNHRDDHKWRKAYDRG